MRRRLLASAALAAGIALTSSAVPAHAAPPAAEKDPILFVHGFTGASENWDYMKAYFQADGYTDLYSFTYDSFQSNAATAEDVKAQVIKIKEETGSPRVDIVAHSMGGLSTRYFIKNLGGNGMVDDWVSLAGPNHGTLAAYDPACIFVSCTEMKPGSDFLNALNAGDETFGKVNYNTLYSAVDGTIIPFESTILEGANNVQTADVDHISLLWDYGTFLQIRDMVRF